MKQFFHRTLALSMAFVVLFSTMSFAIDIHYCGSTVVDYSVFATSKDCGMRKVASDPHCDRPLLTQQKCCSDQQVIKKGQQDLKIAIDQLTIDQQMIVGTLWQSYHILFKKLEKEIMVFKDYPPPFIERNIQVLYQTYLI